MNGRKPILAAAARLDGLAMAALAGFLGWLVARGDYWQYLNPKFKPVTATAAVVLAVLGLYGLWRPVSRPSLGRGLCYLALLGCIGLARGGNPAGSFTANPDSDPFAGQPTLPLAATAPAPVPRRLTVDGKAYIPINTAELFTIAAKGHGGAFSRDYAVRGFVQHAPDLDAKGQFVLYRLAIWCCFADATAVGFRVQGPPGAPLPDNGTWLVAYGHLIDAPADQRQEYVLAGLPFSSIAQPALFAAEHLEPGEFTPQEAAMFAWHDQEPYAY